MRPSQLLTALSFAGAQLGVNASPGHCCQALLDAGLDDGVVLSDNQAYDAGLQKYFSRVAELKPQCFFQPADATEVSRAVIALVAANATQPCQFAIRGGGHIHFPGAAGIEDGVTIDLGRLNHVEYFPNNETVSIGGGAVWGEVYRYLDPLKKMVSGARSAPVGCGGSILGGGNSYYAAREGLSCDNVVQFEIVLGDGSIVTASKDERPDLWQALKGSSNNMGIVTRFDMRAFEGGDIFGGLVAYPVSTADQQLPAFVNFAENVAQDPYASTIMIGVIRSDTKTPVFMNAYEYTKPVHKPDGDIFDEFFAIQGNLSDTTGLRNLTSLVYELEGDKKHRAHFSTLSWKNDIRVLEKAHEAFLEASDKLSAEATGEWFMYVLYQPIPTIFAQIGNENGGNVLGLDQFDYTLIMYETYMSWHGTEQDELFQDLAQWLRDEIEPFAQEIGADSPWLYLNYADWNQDPFSTFGEENVAKIRAASAKYDKLGVFQTMAPGGFKISKVPECSSDDA